MTVTVRFRCMGCDMRLTASSRGVARARELLHVLDATLTRFTRTSELSRLNDDPRRTVTATSMLRAGVTAALWAARRTDGLADPTVLPALRACGYARSRAGAPATDLATALRRAPGRRPAAADPARRWEHVHVDDRAGTITRPPGLELDLGGSAKGLAADLVARLLDDEPEYVVDCAGDLRVRGAGGPVLVGVEHPLTPVRAATVPVDAAVATSGLARRTWVDATGAPAHHLIDPARGTPAWTGLVGATALAPTALLAEALAKTALLSGPHRARTVLREHGGVLVDDDGAVTTIAIRTREEVPA